MGDGSVVISVVDSVYGVVAILFCWLCHHTRVSYMLSAMCVYVCVYFWHLRVVLMWRMAVAAVRKYGRW